MQNPFLLQNLNKRFYLTTRGLCDHIALKKWWKMVVESFFYYNYNEFRSFPSVSKSAFDDQLTMARPFSLLILCFLGAGHLLNFFFKNFEKKHQILWSTAKVKADFFLCQREENRIEVRKNGGRIIFLS